MRKAFSILALTVCCFWFGNNLFRLHEAHARYRAAQLRLIETQDRLIKQNEKYIAQ